MSNLPHVSRHWLFWLLAIVLFFSFLYAIKAILLPFIVGVLVAYFLDPAADKLEEWGASRLLATLLITLAFFGLIILLFILLVPALIQEIETLISTLPGYIQQYQSIIESKVRELAALVGQEHLGSAKDAVSQSSERIAALLGKATSGLLSSSVALINLGSLIVITPIVSFYLLRDWDRIMAQIDDLLPRQYADTIHEQIALIDCTISGFVRGMMNVMIVLGTFYAISLSLIGLDFALIIGIVGGIMIIIPYLGTVISGAAAVGMAYLQFEGWEPVALTLAIFTAGQMLEGYVLTPKLVGDKIGLHPLWLIFGMLAGAALFGFVGILLAIPVTAVIGVLTRFAIQRYKQSDYYQPASDS